MDFLSNNILSWHFLGRPQAGETVNYSGLAALAVKFTASQSLREQTHTGEHTHPRVCSSVPPTEESASGQRSDKALGQSACFHGDLG
jgi:hypothetical protein